MLNMLVKRSENERKFIGWQITARMACYLFLGANMIFFNGDYKIAGLTWAIKNLFLEVSNTRHKHLLPLVGLIPFLVHFVPCSLSSLAHFTASYQKSKLGKLKYKIWTIKMFLGHSSWIIMDSTVYYTKYIPLNCTVCNVSKTTYLIVSI